MTTSSTEFTTAKRSTHPRTGISSGILMLALSLLVLGGCATQQQNGTIIGGITGALIGSVIGDGSGQNVAIAAGAIAGSLIGSSIGQRFDAQDQSRIAYSMERNQRSSWTNSTTGHRYTVMPSPTFAPSSSNQPCREFTVDTEIGNRTESVYGTACRQDDGSWKIIGG